MAFRLSSSAFIDGGHIPGLFTCEGDDVSPPFSWSGAPGGTKSFALLCDDPDAPGGTFHHWAVYNIPSGTDHFDQALPSANSYPQAINDFGKPGYGGPCPPPGHGIHHYRFRLLALDVAMLNLPGEAKFQQVEQAAKPHMIAKAEMTGVYSRE